MQFVRKTKAAPYKIVQHFVPNEFEELPNGDIIVKETLKQDVYLTREEAVKAKIAIEEKIGFHEAEIGEKYVEIVKKSIVDLKKSKDSYDEILSKIKKV